VFRYEFGMFMLRPEREMRMTVRVTVVNSDATFLELIKMLLTDEGIDVVGIHHSETAFNHIKDESPDLVILDIRLEQPESGWNLLQLIRLHPQSKNIPVIVCSADSFFLQRQEQQLEEKGCFIVQKPFDIDDLLAAIQKALSASTA
jgi:DNA-binding response OmpR family regulator